MDKHENVTADFPRRQAGNNPQHLLISLLGDYWVSRPEYLPSAALVRLLEDLGISTESARAALSRLARRGVLEAEKRGRNTYYRLAGAVARYAASVGASIAAFAESQTWSGSITMCIFSLPESRRDERSQLRDRLRILGFIPLYDGVWTSLADRVAAAIALLEEFGIENGSVFTAQEQARPGHQDISAMWSSDDLNESYQAFVDQWSWAPDAIREGQITPRQAFIARTDMIDSYRNFTKNDPGASIAFGAQSARAAARNLFVSVYDQLEPLATIRVRQVIEESSPDAAQHVHSHDIARMRLGLDGVRTCPMCIHADEWTTTASPPTAELPA